VGHVHAEDHAVCTQTYWQKRVDDPHCLFIAERGSPILREHIYMVLIKITYFNIHDINASFYHFCTKIY